MPKRKNSSFESSIHVFRAMERMTQQELADKVGVSRQTIIQLERNRYNPSLLLAHDIADVFEVPIEQIFTFKKVEQDDLNE
ncbi:helix-turn-helix transcriptional regulator [Candidatus Enterococcus ikei]|uniref:Helix-turn-helix transcriptional regulator n=1 Tax=Candidatus Enterococcus ikei TaxID=2815326 RepID=A0ABS3H1X2_9ENTE|nr:helix-turn-helix transcriptional regulator [Enterococcus sp. DIV0869a]MBO0441527.1 helix-turn-helix transcriptional regulator [Enterococcus sp. DIV0869a]